MDVYQKHHENYQELVREILESVAIDIQWKRALIRGEESTAYKKWVFRCISKMYCNSKMLAESAGLNFAEIMEASGKVWAIRENMERSDRK